MTSETLGTPSVSRMMAAQRLGRFPVVVGLALLLCVVVFVWSLQSSYQRARSTETQSRLLAALEQIVATVTTIQSSQRGYVLSGSEDFLSPYHEAKAGVGDDLRAFETAASAAASYPARTSAVINLANREIAFCDRVVELRRTNGYTAAASIVVEGEGKRILDELRAAFRQQRAIAGEIIADNARAQASLSIVQTAIFAFAVLGALAFAGLAWRRQRQVREGAAALAEASSQLGAIADNIPQLAWTARADGEIFWYNRRWFDYTGTTLEEMRGFGWQKVHHPDHVERVVDGYKRSFAQGQAWQDTFPLRGSDGSYRWFLSLATPIRAADGTILRWFGTNTDVTEQRAIEEELLAAKDNADNANRAKSDFIANMSHELRTPLSAVIGYAELLEEEVEELGETHLLADLKKIEGNARHLLGLINSVLDLSKIEAERMDVYPESFDLAQIMDEVAATVGSLVAKKGNTLRVEHDGALGEVHTDQVKLRQCLLNLLSNASKFTENGTITLRGARATDGDRDWITLAVTDSGIGMTEEQVAQLFERFRQADASTTRKYGGTGLGLAITQAFCRLLGGDIGATSEVGRGTTFTIRIPAEFSDPNEEAQATGGEALTVGPAGTVLVIDDDPHARELLTRFLSKEGFAVRTASDGVAGLEMVRALVPDVILLDVTMPKKDGWSVLAELKEDPALSTIPVVMITIMDEQRLGFALGASDYLLKPVEWDKLKEVMDRYRADGAGVVLAIDDDVDTLSRYATMVERQGIAFMSATNGHLGLERVREHRPDLILLDLTMPVMDGFDFLKELRAEAAWCNIPVVVVSSKDLTRAERSTLENTADEVLAKTDASQQLADRIREIVSTHRA